MHLRIIFVFFFVSYNSHGSAQSLPGNVQYKKGDPVPLYANKVGPFANPSEQYEFYTLPFCAPKEEERKGLHLGEVLGGDRMMKSLYSLPFLIKFTARTLCSYTLQPKEIEMFQRAIDEDYFFELIYDGIPVRGFIGEKKKEIVHGETTAAYHLFTHYIFSISHNGEKILGVRWEHDPFDYLDITDKDKEVDVHFKYSSKWLKPSPGTTHLLGDTPADQEHLQIRWFSILNSIGTVLLLTGFLAVILMRVLRNDISRYALMEQGGDSAMTEESGWKLVHGDVFRTPQHPELLCAVLGNGAQLLCIVLGVLLLALLGVYSHYNRGALLVAALILLSVTSGVNGYVAATCYAKLDGLRQPLALALANGLLLAPLFLVGAALNTVAVAYGSSTALPLGTVLVILLLLTLVSLPLNLLGAAAGRALARPLAVPCRTARLPRAVPPLPWHRRGPVLVAVAGFLPFSAIYIELYFIFASVWGHKLYSLYGILALVFGILLVVTAFVTVALTYLQLAAEDHRWCWRSVMSGGVTGGYILAYAVYYFVYKAHMTGFMQTAFFFGYTGIACYAAALLLGTVGFASSFAFVNAIYRSIKCD